MSKANIRFPYSLAHFWAIEAAELLSNYSPRVAIAGSIRRKRDDIGDVDLVVLDGIDDNPWQHSAIAQALYELGYAQAKDGEKISTFTRPGKASLDIYYATPETWGITLVVRTGSAAHNIKLVRAGGRLAPARTFAVSKGILDTAGRAIAGKDELGVFAALQLKYVEPKDREAPEFQHLVGGE